MPAFVRAIQSPHLLEQSGVGSPEALRKANIPLIVDLPGVGENLQEHLFVGVSYGKVTCFDVS